MANASGLPSGRWESRGVCRLGFLALMIVMISTSAVFAQVPRVSPDFVQGLRRVQGDRIVFCVFPDSPTASFEKALADELAHTLLLEAEIFEVVRESTTPPSDAELFILLTDYCDAFFGFVLYPEAYPSWMVLTRPYYMTPYVAATLSPTYRSLADVPWREPVGTVVTSLADIQLVLYQRNRAQEMQWKRYPYPSDEFLFEKLLDGTVEVAIMWGPELYRLVDGRWEELGIRLIDTAPLRRGMEWGIGLALRSRDTFVRTSLDYAIQVLIEDGIMEGLLDEYGVAGRPGDL